MFSIGRKPDGAPKDTLVNVEAGSDFVVHIASADQAPQLNASSAILPYGQSELDDLDLELVEVDGWNTPRLESANIAFNCRRFDVTPVRESTQTLIFGQITHAYVDDTLIVDDAEHLQIDASKVDPLARLGGADYASLGPIFTIPRPGY